MPDIFDQIHAEKQGGKKGGGDIFDQMHAENAAPTPPQQASGTRKSTGGVVADALIGFDSGVYSTARGAYNLARKIPFVGGMLPEPSAEFNRLATAPDSLAGKIGHGVEQAAEFLIPGGAVTKLSKIGQAATAGVRGARALNIGGRAILEGAAAGGVAAVQTGGDVDAMRNAALTGGALSAGAGVIAAGAKPIANALKNSALKQYGQVLNATTKGNKYLSEKVVPELIERGVVAGTMKGLKSKAGAEVDRIGQAIGDEFANLPAGTAVDLGLIVSRLQQTADDALTIVASGGKKVAKGPHAEAGLRNIDGLKQTLTDIAEVNPATGVLEVPVERVRELRQYFDKVASQSGRYEGKALADQAQAEAHGMAADAIRNEMAQAFPDIAKLNKEFTFWKNVDKVVGDTVMRRQGQAKPLGRKIAGAAGAATGFATGGVAGLALGKVSMDTFEALVTSPAWGTVAAVTKDRIAKALASGNRGAAEFYIGKAAKAAALSAAATRHPETPSPALLPAQ